MSRRQSCGSRNLAGTAAFAADTTLALHRNFVVNGFIAKTETPDISSGDMAGYVRGTWLSPSWSVYGEYLDLQENFNAEVGFVPRVGIRTSRFHGEWDPRPGRWKIRFLDPMWNITYTTDQNNRPFGVFRQQGQPRVADIEQGELRGLERMRYLNE